MRRLTAVFLVSLTPLAAAASDLDQPKYVEGDDWVYDTVNKINGAVTQADQEIVVERMQGDKMLVAFKAPGSTKPPTEALVPIDWRRPRSVNGSETVVNRPLQFPLDVGKSWRLDYTENNPNPQHTLERIETAYKVVGWEQVKTQAGEFKALKIEANGVWTAVVPERVFNNAVVARPAPNVAASTSARNVVAGKTVTGRFYKQFYYAPSVKRWVKSIEEYYDANGAVTSSTAQELKAFHAGGG
jgi:hypothetical protein